MSFPALFLEKDDAGFRAGLRELADSDLATHAAAGNVTVRVSWSTVNYKDGLAITGKSPVVRRFPMIPGIDLAGVVESSTHPDFAPGDTAIATGGGPVNASRVLQLYIYDLAFGRFQFGYASALSVALLVVLMTISFVQYRLLRADSSDLD